MSFFFEERSKFSTSLTFFGIKIALASPKIMYLDTYQNKFNALTYNRSVKVINQHAEVTGTIKSLVLKISSCYTEPFRLAEFSRIG